MELQCDILKIIKWILRILEDESNDGDKKGDPSDANGDVISLSPAAPYGECHKRSENDDGLKKLIPGESVIKDPKIIKPPNALV